MWLDKRFYCGVMPHFFARKADSPLLERKKTTLDCGIIDCQIVHEKSYYDNRDKQVRKYCLSVMGISAPPKAKKGRVSLPRKITTKESVMVGGVKYTVIKRAYRIAA